MPPHHHHLLFRAGSIAKLFPTLEYTLKSKRDFTALSRLDTTARAEIGLKSYLKYSLFHTFCRLTYYVDNFSGSCPFLEYTDLQGGVKKLVIITISLISTQPLNFHHSKYPRATGILGVSKYAVPRRWFLCEIKPHFKQKGTFQIGDEILNYAASTAAVLGRSKFTYKLCTYIKTTLCFRDKCPINPIYFAIYSRRCIRLFYNYKF